MASSSYEHVVCRFKKYPRITFHEMVNEKCKLQNYKINFNIININFINIFIYCNNDVERILRLMSYIIILYQQNIRGGYKLSIWKVST